MSLDFNCQFQRPPQDRDRPGFHLDLNFTAGAGITALWGPSGSGKTTVLHLIAGLLQPHTGTITLHGQVLVDTAQTIALPPEQRHLGVVFQDHLLFPHRTVEQNLTYGRARRHAPAAPDATPPIAFDRLVEVLELQDLLQRRPATLSGGQARRVALGRALFSSPRMLLMDEPLTGLDDELKNRIVDYLERVRNEWRIPILLVTHERSTVERMGASVVELLQPTAG